MRVPWLSMTGQDGGPMAPRLSTPGEPAAPQRNTLSSLHVSRKSGP
jgi:hypothetical protein